MSNATKTVSSSSPSSITAITGTNTATGAATPSDRQLIFVQATYTTSATAGNRYLVLQLLNASGTVVGDWYTSAAMTASGVYRVDFVQGTYRETAFDTNKTIQTPFPAGLIIPANYTIKVLDIANISASDSMTVSYQTMP